jgi:vacuolar iron transporter family protein
MKETVRKELFLSQAIIGISDGIIVPFAFTTGIGLIATGNHLILQAGLIVLMMGSVFMALGGYFAAKSRQESFAKKSKEEETLSKKIELEKTTHLFKELNMGDDMLNQASEEIEKDSQEWKAYLNKHSQELEIPDPSHLPKTAFIIAVSYAMGGLIPLLPYLYFTEKNEALKYASILSLTALLFLGYIKSKVNKEPVVWGTIRLAMLGAVAAAAAYAVAKIFVA